MHNSHGWTVEYYALDPTANTLKRHTVKMNVLRKQYQRLADFKAHCNTVMATINTKLAGGWSPFGETQNARLFTPIAKVTEAYITEKAAELRHDTITNYRSFCKVFTEWTESVSPSMQVGLFNKVLAVRFMDFLFDEKGLRGRAWNNRLKQARAFFGWATEKCYAKENPFETIKPKREDPKKRVLIPQETRKRITDYWERQNPNYIVLLEMVYSALIRPKEAWRLTVGDVFLKEGYIYIKESEAKTHYSRFATLSADLSRRLAKMTDGHAPTDFVFGDGYRPKETPVAYSRMRKDWDKMRKELQLPQEMQLYSLRDTGINEMLKAGIDPLTVMQHADHHDLSMTTRYANHADPNLVETIRRRAPEF